MVLEKFDGCLTVICYRTFPLTLILIEIKSFNFISVMDWLSSSRAKILCDEKHIRILFTECGHAIVRGKKSFGSIPIISIMKVCKCLARGCEVFLAQVIESSRKMVDFADVEVVKEFSDVFHDKLLGLPPQH